MITAKLIALLFPILLGREVGGVEGYTPAPFGSDVRVFWVSGEPSEATKNPTGSDVRAVLDGKYALTAEQYAQYQACIGKIPLGHTPLEYRADVAK